MEYLEVIIESAGGSNQKYDYDPIGGHFKLTKLLPQGMVFPFDFGFIPGTVGGDGDPLDVMVITETPTFTGCRVNCRIIGALVCEQTETDGLKTSNDRYIGIADISEQYAKVNKFSELPKGLIEKLEQFFINYNDIAGKKFVVNKHIGSVAAKKQIENSTAEDSVSIRLELMAPETDEEGNKFPEKYFRDLEKELTKQFGGLTVYQRTPVQGMWQDQSASTEQSMFIYELLLPKIDIAYWQNLKEKLEKNFAQKEILIIHGPASKIC
ncbi:MAG: inorganic diphosphatase [Acinetobacter sp.]|nr:MAG: inorganic diphosphatase [Acinetobacter sp.]